jgi:hypothetical protein
MAVKILQSLVLRGAPVVGARMTGRKTFGQTLPAALSMPQHREDYLVPGVETSTSTGAGRSLSFAGAVNAVAAINARRAVLSGWPASSATTRKPRPAGPSSGLDVRGGSALIHSAPQALWCGPKAGI